MSRLQILFVLVAYDYKNHNDFYDTLGIDATNIHDSLLEGHTGIHSSKIHKKNRHSASLNFLTHNYKMQVDDAFIYKKAIDGINMAKYYVICINIDSQRVSKVERSYEQFIAFESTLKYSLRGTGMEPPSLERGSSEIDFVSSFLNQDNQVGNESQYSKNVEDEVQNIRLFCKKITNDKQYYTEGFYEFFEIPDHMRINQDDSASGGLDKSRVSDIRFSDSMNTSIISDISGARETSLMHKWQDFRHESSRKYCMFFLVQLVKVKKEDEGHYTFHFEIEGIFCPGLKFTLRKRYSDFVALAKELKNRCNARTPPLPPKHLINKSQDKMNHRGAALRKWLEIVSNEKTFLIFPLLEFMELSENCATKLQNLDPAQVIKRNCKFNISIQGTEQVNLMTETFTLYSINVDVSNKELLRTATGFSFKRRFAEFGELDKQLRTKFQKYKKKLPELPSKIRMTLMGNPILGESRQQSLENYLQALVDYPDVFDSISFRKFLNFGPKQFLEYNCLNVIGQSMDTASQI